MDHRNQVDEKMLDLFELDYEDWREYALLTMSFSILPEDYIMWLGDWSDRFVFGAFAHVSGEWIKR